MLNNKAVVTALKNEDKTDVWLQEHQLSHLLEYSLNFAIDFSTVDHDTYW